MNIICLIALELFVMCSIWGFGYFDFYTRKKSGDVPSKMTYWYWASVEYDGLIELLNVITAVVGGFFIIIELFVLFDWM